MATRGFSGRGRGSGVGPGRPRTRGASAHGKRKSDVGSKGALPTNCCSSSASRSVLALFASTYMPLRLLDVFAVIHHSPREPWWITTIAVDVKSAPRPREIATTLARVLHPTV